MPDQLLIYLIVLLNALCQAMLIWRLKYLAESRFLFLCCALIIPLSVALIMRLFVAKGFIHGHLSEQSGLEQLVTRVMSILLIAGPWLVTLAAIARSRGKKTVVQQLKA